MENEYKIRFSSLKDGLHTFTYNIGDEFFEQFEITDVKGADIKVEVELEKQPTMMIVSFNISGNSELMCDRCTDNVTIPIESFDELIYKFTETEFDDEKVVSVYHNEIDIDLTQPIFEFITLSIPSKRLHKKGGCNQTMLKEINNYLLVEEEDENLNESTNGLEENETDPRWSALNKLKFKK
jgi:uncharacterized metal-binding protein YceD (DUF177 family)